MNVDMTLKNASLTMAVALVLLAGTRSLAQDANGPELEVNTYTTGNQWWGSPAVDGSGHFVVTWSGPGDGDDRGVFARRLSSSGVPLGPEFRVNSYTTDYQGFPAAAANRAGEFVVTWTGHGASSSQYGIFGQRFDAGGLPVGSDFQVSTGTCCEKWSRMAMDAAGDFVVVWEALSGQDGDGRGIFGRRYDAVTGFGPTFVVNAYTTSFQQSPAIAMAADGSFVVAWHGVGAADSTGVFARRFDATGAPVGDDFLVNEVTTGDQIFPSVGSAPDESFVVAWEDAAPASLGDVVLGRRFDSGGAPIGGEFQVSGATTYQRFARVAVDPAGAFMVTWSDYSVSDGSGGSVRARHFDGAGTPVGSEFRVNSYTTGTQSNPAIAAGPAGQFVVTWWSSFQDGSGYGMVGRRFGDLIFADSFESGGLFAWSASATDGGDLSVSPNAAVGGPGQGLQAMVNDTAAIYVEDDSPADEDRYRARFYFDTHGFDPGVAQGHVRTRIFIGFEENPDRRLFAIVLRLLNGQYGLMGRVRRDDDGQTDTGFFPIPDGPHFVEVDWRRSSGQDAPDGTFEMWIDGTSVATLTGLANGASSVDFARLGALSVKGGSGGTLYFDAFESRRLTAVGPLP